MLFGFFSPDIRIHIRLRRKGDTWTMPGILYIGITIFALSLEKLPESTTAMNLQYIFKFLMLLFML